MGKEVRNQKPGGRGASRAGAIEDGRDGSAAGLLWTREWGQGNGRVVGGRVGCSGSGAAGHGGGHDRGLPLHAGFRITINKAHDQRHRHSPVPIPLSQKTCAKRFEIKNLEGEGPPEPVRLRTAEMLARRGFCGQGNGDRGMAVSLVDALVVPDLAQLGMVVATTWPALARGVSPSPSTKRMTNDIVIPCPHSSVQKNMRKEVRNQKIWRARSLPSRCDCGRPSW